MRSLTQWLGYIQSVHPRSIELGLERVGQVANRLGLLPLRYYAVVISGTNGKGSSASLLGSIFFHAGYKTAVYTSPHLVNYRERIQINRQWISEQDLCRAFTAIEQAREDVQLTYFEFGTLAALWWFQEQKIDIAVLEVGMGGRLDAVNIVDGDAALITSIDLDHREWLGSDRASIAAEKAGIMRQRRPAVCSDPSPPETLLQAAIDQDVRLYCLRRDYGHVLAGDRWRWWAVDGSELLDLPLPAPPSTAQLNNAAGVIMVAHLILNKLPVADECIAVALTDSAQPGRCQEFPGPPRVVLDVAHNPGATRELADFLASRPVKGRTYAVFGALQDKDVHRMVAIAAPFIDAWYLCALPTERTLSLNDLQETVSQSSNKAPVLVFDDPVSAFNGAHAACNEEDRICAFGSFYVVGDIIAHRQQLGL